MNKQDHVNYCRTTAESDWTATEHLFEKGDYLQSLFFAHLVLKKLLKAHWVKDNKIDYPPRIHRLISLKEKIEEGFDTSSRQAVASMSIPSSRRLAKSRRELDH